MRSRPSGFDFVPLAERLRYLRLFRLSTASVVIASWPLLAGMRHVGLRELAAASAAYLLLTFAAELTWRLRRRRGRHIQTVMLFLDGLYLAAVAYAMGGVTSPLRVIVVVHLIAVALLGSFRAGLKLALWHSLLLYLTIYGQESGLLADFGQSVALWGPEFRLVVAWIAAFWLAALTTATFGSVNERELRRQRYEFQALSQLAYRLERETQPEPVAAALVGAVADDLGFGRALLFQLTPDDVVLLERRGGHGVEGDRNPPSFSSPGGRALSDRETLLVAAREARQDTWLASWLPDPKNLVLVPLQAENRVLGLIVAEHDLRRDSRIERRLVAMLERFASQGALALDNAWLLAEIAQAAATDGLTGLANRTHLEADLGRELARAERTGSPISLIMLDIDHFKAVNDSCGHQAGDAVLQAVAGALLDVSRASDLVARYGGEEFAVVAPDADESHAVELAERLRTRIADLAVAVPVTASFGVASYPQSAFDVESLLRAADSALYVSKRSGRNRTTGVSSPPSAAGATRGADRRTASVRDALDTELLDRALRDPVTGLANRPRFLDHLGLALARAPRRGGCVAVLLVDVDRFKQINDSLGHEAGDRALVALARRLEGLTRAGETIARTAANEFALVCEISDQEEAHLIATRLHTAVHTSLTVDGEELALSASLGTAIVAAGQAPHDVLRDAETALGRAKELGGGRSEMFNVGLREQILGRISLEKQLRRAIERDELCVVYQPKVRLRDGQLTGFEALVRWNHPERGLVAPAEFIPLAEQTGLIVPIETFVIGEACRQSARWRTAHPELQPDMAVNVSARHLADERLLATLEDALAETGIAPESLTLEITETTLMHDPEAVAATLRVLKRLGLGIALDDFGTGYSSLGLLRQLPIDTLKIDRSFVAGLGARRENHAIVEAIKGIADALDLSLVAEGIETNEQLETLLALACETGQGYLFAPPRSVDLAGELLVTAAHAAGVLVRPVAGTASG